MEKVIKKEKELRDDTIAKKKGREQLLEKVKKEVMEYEEKEAQLVRIIKNVSMTIFINSSGTVLFRGRRICLK